MKYVVVYGNCHTEVIADMLNASDYFKASFRILPIKPVYQIKSKDYFEDPVFSECDIFIHQAIRLNNRYGEEFASERVIQRLKKGCRIIAIPNVYRLPTCFFPQFIDANGLAIRNQIQCFRDSIIEEGREKGYSVKEILEKYESENLYSEESVISEYQKFINKVRLREADWDIKVSDFIEQNYRTHQLFYDPNHPTNFFLAYVANEILNILFANKQTGSIDYFKDVDMKQVRKLDTYEMPVTPCVKKCLGIEGGYHTIYRDTGNRLEGKDMGLEEYIRQYLAVRWADRSLPLPERTNSFVHWFSIKLHGKLQKIK